METPKLNLGQAILRVLVLIIVKPFTLPLKIYHNTLLNLSNSDKTDSAENTLSIDFPIYVWFIDLFDAVIALTYPIGFILAIISGINDSFSGFLLIVIGTYFMPLTYGLFKELFSITLRALQYLKIISSK